MTQWHPMTDKQAFELLQLLQLYLETYYEPEIPQTIAALAEDLVAGNGPEARVLADYIVRTLNYGNRPLRQPIGGPESDKT